MPRSLSSSIARRCSCIHVSAAGRGVFCDVRCRSCWAVRTARELDRMASDVSIVFNVWYYVFYVEDSHSYQGVAKKCGTRVTFEDRSRQQALRREMKSTATYTNSWSYRLVSLGWWTKNEKKHDIPLCSNRGTLKTSDIKRRPCSAVLPAAVHSFQKRFSLLKCIQHIPVGCCRNGGRRLCLGRCDELTRQRYLLVTKHDTIPKTSNHHELQGKSEHQPISRTSTKGCRDTPNTQTPSKAFSPIVHIYASTKKMHQYISIKNE